MLKVYLPLSEEQRVELFNLAMATIKQDYRIQEDNLENDTTQSLPTNTII